MGKRPLDTVERKPVGHRRIVHDVHIVVQVDVVVRKRLAEDDPYQGDEKEADPKSCPLPPVRARRGSEPSLRLRTRCRRFQSDWRVGGIGNGFGHADTVASAR